MNSTKERLLWLDLAKGIGIVLVVMGHTLFPLHQAIDIFHMPLFFILAGLTFRPATMENFLLKKIDSIYLPFVCFTMISLPISFLVPHEGGFNGPLWFLQTLFVDLILIQLTYRLCDKSNTSFDITGGVILVLSAIVAVLMLRCSNVVLPFDMTIAIRALPFILLGYLLKRFFIGTERINKNWLLFTVTLVIYSITLGVDIKIYDATGSFANGKIIESSPSLFYVAAIAGSFSVIAVSRLLDKVRIINWLGRNSLVIMCVHFPLVQWLNEWVSKTQLYKTGGLVEKSIIGLSIVSIGLSFGALCAVMCKRYIPQLTGYKRNFKNI